MKLIRNARSLLLGLIVIGNRILSAPEEHRYWRVCDSILFLGPNSQGLSCVKSIECCDFTTSLRIDKKEKKKEKTKMLVLG